VEIVLVHLNTRVPSYLKANLKQLRKKFPQHDVVLVSNVKQPKIAGINFKIYSESEYSREINRNLSHPKSFRSNFWHSSIARFTYLLSYQQEIQRPILHVESDVILSRDFPFKRILMNDGIAFPVLSKYRGVASVFYSSNFEHLNWFVGFLVEEARRDHDVTDMTAMRRYLDSYPKRVSILPAGPEDSSVYEPEILSDIFKEVIESLEDYGGVFDGSDIGMYLFGTDPRNLLGKTILRQEISSTYTIMSKMEFRFNRSREFLDIRSGGNWLPIYNLHMTCKDKNLFLNKNIEKKFDEYMKESELVVRFLPKIYLQMGLAKIRRTISSIYR
jgi:hypothetical protein